MADERYADRNGVTWVLSPSNPGPGRVQWAGWVAPDNARVYDPEPGGFIRQTKRELVADIEAYAKANSVALRVTARADGAGWMILALIVLALADNRW